MSMSAKTVLLALLVLPGVTAVEGEPASKARSPKATQPELHAEIGAASPQPIRCRIYFGCAPVARTASATGHPVPEQ